MKIPRPETLSLPMSCADFVKMLRRGVVAGAFACLAFISLFVTESSAKAVHRGFIRMQDGLFVDQECREFNFVGANACVSKA